MPPEIRDAVEADLPGLLAIYNDVIATTTAVYRDDPTTLEERTRWWRDRVGQGYPVLVAVQEDEVLGFATFGDFRPFPGYRTTVEHTVHVRADRRGQGVGLALMAVLDARARAMGKHVMVAGVDAGNLASVRFHEQLGFVRAGLLPQVAMKFGRWVNLLFLLRILD